MRAPIRIAAALALLPLLATACTPVAAREARPLDRIVTEWQERSGVPSVVVAVARPGEPPAVLTAGDATPDDRFRIGSITKTFVATTLVRLAEQGVLSLDDRLDRWVPEPARFGHATLRQLLDHTAGVPNYTAGTDVFEETDRVWTTDELIALTDGQQPTFAPGTDWAYSNTGYLLLGQVIEAATGRPYGDVLHDLVLAPLGLRSTGTDLPPTVAGWYDLDRDGTDEDVSADPFVASLTGAAGEMSATAGELARFTVALLTGEVVSDASLAEMTTPGSDAQAYGLGLAREVPDGSTEVWGHGGSVVGYTAVTWWVPSLEAAIVVLLDANTAHAEDLGELVLRHLQVAGA